MDRPSIALWVLAALACAGLCVGREALLLLVQVLAVLLLPGDPSTAGFPRIAP